MRSSRVVVALLALALGGCRLFAVGEAKHLEVEKSDLSGAEVLRLEPNSNSFLLRAKLDMPTPGFTLGVDSVQQTKPGQIEAKVTGVPPQGNVTQVVTATTVTIPLGLFDPGRYTLTVLYRTGESAYRPSATVHLRAR